ncbi:hypothetical protein HanIR_Chr04g0163401 [Helianthus annuus]|nr:hypothetical protein HanIR_Chr04g0163401 [Helianthus annuus]
MHFIGLKCHIALNVLGLCLMSLTQSIRISYTNPISEGYTLPNLIRFGSKYVNSNPQGPYEL